jgi:hypothetical protein
MLSMSKVSKGKVMSSKNSHKEDEGNRALWERPAFRRLVTEYAEGGGILHDEGNPTTGMCAQPGPGGRSCKTAG